MFFLDLLYYKETGGKRKQLLFCICFFPPIWFSRGGRPINGLIYMAHKSRWCDYINVTSNSGALITPALPKIDKRGGKQLAKGEVDLPAAATAANHIGCINRDDAV